MVWMIELELNAEKELNKLDPQDAKRILRFLFERVSHLKDLRSIGEALKGSRFNTLWKYRVGDYRLISTIEDDTKQIIIIKINNRRNVYK